MICDVIYFNKYVFEVFKEFGLMVLGFMDKLGMGCLFCKYYLLLFLGVIWLILIEKIGDFFVYVML